MIEPKDPTKIAKENAKTSKSTPWKIFPNVAIKLPTDETTEKIGTDGEIDLIILANMNLYLIELKALNLTSKESSYISKAKLLNNVQNTLIGLKTVQILLLS